MCTFFSHIEGRIGGGIRLSPKARKKHKVKLSKTYSSMIKLTKSANKGPVCCFYKESWRRPKGDNREMLESFFARKIKTNELIDTEAIERFSLILSELPEKCRYRISLNKRKWILSRKNKQIAIERDSWYKYKSCFPVIKFAEENGKIASVCTISPTVWCKYVMLSGLAVVPVAFTGPLVLAFHHCLYPGDIVGWLIIGAMFIFAFPVSHYLMFRSERKRLLNGVPDFTSSLYVIKDGRPWPSSEKQDWISDRLLEQER